MTCSQFYGFVKRERIFVSNQESTQQKYAKICIYFPDVTMRHVQQFFGLSFFTLTLAASLAHADIATEEFQRNQERLRQLRQQMTPDNDVRLPRDRREAFRLDPAQPETPCFSVNAVTLDGEFTGKFRASLKEVLDEAGFVAGMCLGTRSINLIMTRAQDRVIANGFITTRIVAQAQNIARDNTIQLLVIPGKLRAIRFEGVSDRKDWAGNAARTQYFRNEFPMQGGDLLNLRDIETALENLRRLESVEADFEITPTDQPGQSDLVVKWKQRFPIRITLSADDSGSRWTGKNQGAAVISVDNPLGLSDTFYAYYNHDLGHKHNIKDHTTGEKRESGTKGHGFHYSAPFGNHAVSYNFNHNQYAQAVAGYFTNYLYRGWSEHHDLTLKRTLYRAGNRKTTSGIGAWIRSSRNYIDDAELTVQRRRMAGWHLEVEHTEYIGNATVNAYIRYKRGTGLHHALKAPEEEFDEGTNKMRIVTADLSLNLPFRVREQSFSYATQVHVQNNRTPVITQDQISIGNRYTVRGFDGEMTLMAERGFYWRNELAWRYAAGHQVYALWDSGHVSGASTKWLAGRYLEGYGVGVRGQIMAGGRLSYDIFTARPAKHPDAFPVQHSVVGASLSYSF
ncbi:hemin transporter [Betaproteobacteria bacterium]|nr:hemin transporter [Betaproteobacteria bacterium]